MESVSTKKEIANTYESIRSFSFGEKREQTFDEEKVNSFLDKILDFKVILSNHTTKIAGIVEKLEEITWLSGFDEEALMTLNDIISAAKDLKSNLIRQYVSMGQIRKKGIARKEIQEFKQEIDALGESYTDLESVFFFLPAMPEFKETTKLNSVN